MHTLTHTLSHILYTLHILTQVFDYVERPQIAQDKDGKPVIRPYTPISTNAMVGKFELMVRGCFFRNPNPTQHRIRQSSHQ